MAESVRYVQVPEYSEVIADLSKSSQDIAAEIETADEARVLHTSKYAYVKRASELVDELSKDIAKLVREMPIKKLGKSQDTKTEKRTTVQARLKSFTSEADKELVARSHRALQHLQENLAELKSELRKV